MKRESLGRLVFPSTCCITQEQQNLHVIRPGLPIFSHAYGAVLATTVLVAERHVHMLVAMPVSCIAVAPFFFFSQEGVAFRDILVLFFSFFLTFPTRPGRLCCPRHHLALAYLAVQVACRRQEFGV